jgi:hypothetical protein
MRLNTGVTGLRCSNNEQVNNTLYRVYKYPIQQASTVFAAMFELGHQDTAEGSADQDPIVLNAVPAEEFEAFLSSLFSTHWYVLTLMLMKRNVIRCLSPNDAI